MRPHLITLVIVATALSPVAAAPPRVLPEGAQLDDARLGPPRTLEGYFPFTPVADAAAWPARRNAIRRRVLVAAGLWPMPDRPALRPVIHGRIDKGDYTIEKVFFESFPGHFVTGNLYRPAGASLAAGRPAAGRRPGVLCPHGHWPGGRFMDTGAEAAHTQIEIGAEQHECGARSVVQARCVGLARIGCVVFHYDMLGNADSIQFPEHCHGPKPALEGHEPGSWGLAGCAATARLQTHFGVQTFNSVRALDFLLGLADVDAERVAVTGASGGGTQTMILAAIDDRVRAAFPAVMVSTGMQGGCSCENAAYLRIGQGNIDIAAATAPRPLGLTAADDWTKELEHKGWPDLAGLYRMLGVPENAEAHFDIRFKHNYNAVSRRHCYRFLDRVFALGQPDAGTEREFDRLDRSQLTVWDDAHPAPGGSAVGDDHERSLCRAWAEDAERKIAPLLLPADAAALAQARDLLGGAVAVMVGRAPLAAADIAFERSAKQPAVPAGAAAIEAGLVRVIPHGERIPTLVLRPADWQGDVAIWPHPQGKQGLFTAGGELVPAVRAELARGTAVIAADLFGQGECVKDGGPPLTDNPRVQAPGRVDKETDRWRLDPIFYYGYNPSAFVRRVHDLMALVTFARSGTGRPARQVTLVGVDGAGHWAAGALAALEPWKEAAPAVDRAVIDTAGFRFGGLRDVWSADFLPGAAKYGDLPALLALGLPTALEVRDPDPACGRLLQAWARAAGDPGQVTLLAGPPVPAAESAAPAGEPPRELPPAAGTLKARDIQGRFVPSVAGLDLEHALNYTDSDGLDLAWFYRSFTSPRVFYKPGSRPVLEKIVWQQTTADAPDMDRLRACLDVVVERMPHYLLLGYSGATDRGLTEEALLESGHGWCNEQARVLLALTQIAKLPSRLVFAQSRDGQVAHVVTEVYVDGSWVLVDQTEGLIFTRSDGRPINVLDLRTDPAVWREADAAYKARQHRNRELAKDKAFWDRGHAIARREHPLDLFECVGYQNYFIH